MKNIKNINNTEVIGCTKLVLKKDWNTIYNIFKKGEIKTLSEFAQLFSTTTHDFIEQFKKGYLNNWFDIVI